MQLAAKDDSVRHIIPAILLGSLVFVAILYLNAHYPYMLDEVRYAIGNQNATASAEYTQKQKERERLRRIDTLLISDRNKKDLREGRPFWGASSNMIDLAFATTARDIVVRMRQNTMYEFHQYVFNRNQEAIIFEYQNSKLACAHYVSQQRSICGGDQLSYYGHAGMPFKQVTAENR